MDINDRRNSPRVFHAAKAVVEHPSGQSERCNTIDLSASGVTLDVGHNFALGQIVTLRFLSNSESECVVRGEVKRSKPAFGGRRFETALAFQSQQPRLYTRAQIQEQVHEQL